MRYAAAIVILGASAASAFAPSAATVQLPSAASKLSADRISKHTASAILGARGGFTVSFFLVRCGGAEQQLLGPPFVDALGTVQVASFINPCMPLLVR